MPENERYDKGELLDVCGLPRPITCSLPFFRSIFSFSILILTILINNFELYPEQFGTVPNLKHSLSIVGLFVYNLEQKCSFGQIYVKPTLLFTVDTYF